MREKKYYVTFDEYEHGVMIRTLNDKKTQLMNEGKNADAVNDLIIKVGTAPQKSFKLFAKMERDETK